MKKGRFFKILPHTMPQCDVCKCGPGIYHPGGGMRCPTCWRVPRDR